MDNITISSKESCSFSGNAKAFEGTMNIPYKYHDNQVVAMAYVPWQHWDTPYEPCKALAIGTIFPDLNRPFEGGYCR